MNDEDLKEKLAEQYAEEADFGYFWQKELAFKAGWEAARKNYVPYSLLRRFLGNVWSRIYYLSRYAINLIKRQSLQDE
jgi:hypothetical protein